MDECPKIIIIIIQQTVSRPLLRHDIYIYIYVYLLPSIIIKIACQVYSKWESIIRRFVGRGHMCIVAITGVKFETGVIYSRA